MPDYSFHEKYQTLIDAQTWAFIERTNGWFLPDAVGLPVEKQREIYGAMCKDFYAGRPDGITVVDSIEKAQGRSIAVRSYEKTGAEPEAQVLYAHGGGYILGNLDSHDDVCAEICECTGYGVLSVDYRLSPEHSHPTAFDDVLAGYVWLSGQVELPVIMAGDSAGACLVAAVCHAMRVKGQQPAGQVLIYPTMGGNPCNGSYIEHAHAPLLDLESVKYYLGVRQGGVDLSRDATHAPLVDTDFSHLPPTVIFSAQCDPLSDDGREYRDRIRAAGGKAVWFNEPGLVHGFLRARHCVKRAGNSFSRIIDAISVLGRGEWKY